MPFAKDIITGHTIIETQHLDEAENIVRNCPVVASIRVCEISKSSDVFFCKEIDPKDQ